MRKHSILVVDDDRATLKYLVEALRENYEAEGCDSGEEAVRLVDRSPERFNFVVVDHQLKDGCIDGIETAGRIAEISESIFILVFTNLPTDDPAKQEENRHKAFASGAHRYIERDLTAQQVLQVEQFVEEMEQLSKLRERVTEYYVQRRHVPSLLTQLDLGVDIVDRAYKIWFMNETMRRITSPEGEGLPRQRCSHWHGYRVCPCPGCLVKKTLDTGETADRIFLSPIQGNPGKLVYLHIWTQPVLTEDGEVLLAKDGKPLAVMENVQDLTDTDHLKALPFRERIAIIARAMHERLRKGFERVQPFEKVAVYAVNPPNEGPRSLSLQAVAGYEGDHSHRLGAPLDPQTIPQYEDIIGTMRQTGMGKYSSDQQREDPIDGSKLPRCVYWPVIEADGTIMALVRAGGERCSLEDVEMVRAYADEVRSAIKDAQHGQQLFVSKEAEDFLMEVDNEVQTIASPEAALRFLVTKACEFTDSYLGHIRERRENQARLVRLGPHPFDGYEKVANAEWPLTHRSSWSARTILSGMEKVAPDVSQIPTLLTDREVLSPAAAAALQEAHSFCFEPLVFDGRSIGAMGFYSRNLNNYTPERLWALKHIARRASLAMHDYMTKRNAEERFESMTTDTVDLLLHNINQPLSVLRNDQEVLQRTLSESSLPEKKWRPSLEAMARACDRIGRIREDLAMLLKPVDKRREPCDLHELVHEAINGVVCGREDVQVVYELPGDLVYVVTNRAVIRSCLETLAQNALDEFDRLTEPRDCRITVSLRHATGEEGARVASHESCLAMEVEDTGPGISKEIQATLFTVIRSKKATGLGIALTNCRRTAREVGGDLYFDAGRTEGAKFTSIIPYSKPERSNRP